MNILIAEDDLANQNVAELMMKMWGFEFDITSNGKEAVERVQGNHGKYDLCLMDIDMPVMDGCEATKNIRQKSKYFPIMALTADPDFKEKYLEVGMDDFLQKPYDPDQLYNKINELTIKLKKIYFKQNKLCLKKETPMNQKELQELIELKKKGLTKIKLVGIDHTFVLHKNIQNKISYDLIGIHLWYRSGLQGGL
jgi:CheY-like chemotaxis protein